jgi:hypothetical protein
LRKQLGPLADHNRVREHQGEADLALKAIRK